MLVLKRKVGEWITIDGDIAVKVIEAWDDGVKLGFRAPQEVSIRRGELPPRDATTESVRKSRTSAAS
jgi:carbon storage regulator CsrA